MDIGQRLTGTDVFGYSICDLDGLARAGDIAGLFLSTAGRRRCDDLA